MADKPEIPTPAVQYEEQLGSRMTRKFKEAPFVPMGLAGFFAALGYGAYMFNRKGTMSTSVYLMHLRVQAQAMVVGAITIGVGYTLFKKLYEEHEEHKLQMLDQDIVHTTGKRLHWSTGRQRE